MLKILLTPLSWLYGLGVFIRNRAYDLNILKSKEFDVPVISVGNITVGGTGKTPHVEYLVEQLKEKYKVATLSRGYKRKTKGFRWVATGSTASEVGDEPLQIKKKFPEITVAVCENRVKGVEELLKDNNDPSPDVILLDDAFQHRRITPGINILLINYNRQLKHDHLLPVGRMRERAHQVSRANIIIFTKCPDEIAPITRRILQNDVELRPYQNLFFTKFEYGKLQPVNPNYTSNATFCQQKEYAILVVTGIASPELLIKHLSRFSNQIEELAFPDHHAFSPNDITAIQNKFEQIEATKKIIVTTEKDAVRFKDYEFLSNDLKNIMYFMPIKVKFLDEGKNTFTKEIINYVGENKSNRELYKKQNSGKS